MMNHLCDYEAENKKLYHIVGHNCLKCVFFKDKQNYRLVQFINFVQKMIDWFS